jgi:Tfp pilus assembly protein PilO
MGGPEAVGMLAMVALVGVSILTLAKAFAKRIAGGSAGSREIEALRDEVAQLRAEVDDIRAQLPDVDEIQNRLDFAERLLGQVRERGLLSAPKER